MSGSYLADFVQRHRRVQALSVLMAIIAGMAVSAATIERASAWREHEIVVDGRDDDWQGLTLPVKGQHFALGIVNDGEWLYLCLPTKDFGTRTQIERFGLMIWLDKDGGKKNNFGIHFPIPRGGSPGAKPGRDGEQQGNRPAPGQDAIVILGPGLRDGQVVPFAQAGGLEARVGLHDDSLVYELKVPLRQTSDHPYAPNVGPGETLRVQFETPAVGSGRAPFGPTLPGGIVIGPVQVGGGGGGVGVGVGSQSMLKPFDVTMKVRLAAGPPR